MMGRRENGQGQFFYSFDLDEVVPPDHLVRQIDDLLDLSWVHKELGPYYSHTGRPSIDPVLMIRMLLVGYIFAIRSERGICAEIQVNLAYRWFCKLGIEDKIPDHSVFCRARHERFRESDALRRVFEGVVAMSIAAGLVGGEAFSIDASLIKADVDKKKRMPGDQPIAWPKTEEASHAVREYLAALDTARGDEDRGGDDGPGEGGQRRKPPKEVSLTDPHATWVARPGLDPFFAECRSRDEPSSQPEGGRARGRRESIGGGRDRPARLRLYVCFVGYEQRALLDAVRVATGGVPLAGASGAGIIAGVEADESNFSVAVMTISSDELNFTNAMASGLKADSEAAGRTIAQNLACEVQPDTLGLIMLGDGLTLNFDRFAAGLKGELQLDRHLPLFGGTSADNLEFKQTYQYCDDQITSDGVACILLSGSARLAWSVNHGCLPIGGERKVTRCSGNVIYEIDGMPVLDVLKEYLVGDEIDNWSKAVLSLCMASR